MIVLLIKLLFYFEGAPGIPISSANVWSSSQFSAVHGPELAVDGNTSPIWDDNTTFATIAGDLNRTMDIDLTEFYEITDVTLYNRNDSCGSCS